jgi:hypothetical protein
MPGSWYFREMNQKQSRQGDIPTKHALDEDTNTFVREVLQNANDAGPVNKDEPVVVTFRFTHITENECREFKSALKWDDQLLPHLDAAAEEETDLSLEHFLNDKSDELVLLTIEDQNTQGLSGKEDADESNYTALVRDMHRSNKDDTQGGSHGVGGTVLWAFSGISTVLFTSNPVERDGHEPPRFVGRSYLPDHLIGDNLYKGYGWFGQPDPDDETGRHISLWGNDADSTAASLYGNRPDEFGTTTTIVGFREPGEGQPTGENMVETVELFKRSAVENFWPAILRGNLKVKVQGPEDDSPQPANLETVNSVEPFVDSYRRMYKNDGKVGEPGGVKSEHVDFDFPTRSDGADTPDQGTVTVSVRTAGPSDDERRNQIAVFRGSGMVVQYVDLSDVAKYGADFHGILAAGRARASPEREPDDADLHVEKLLRAAEPAAHDEWTGTPRLKNEYNDYPVGRVGLVKSLQGSRLRDTVRDLITDDDESDGERISNFEKWFPGARNESTSDGPSPPSPSTPSVSSINRDIHDFSFNGTRWTFDVSIEPNVDTDEGWEVKLWLTQLIENGGDGERISIDSVETVNVEVEDAICGIDASGNAFVQASSPGAVRLRCQSRETGRLDPTSGRIGRTGIRHELVEDEE